MRDFSLLRGPVSGAFAIMAMTSPALAQEAGEADIDALLAASSTPSGAISMARSQAEAGDLTGAAATLERALLDNPDAHQIRLAYAGLLCRLDDPQGARVELTQLDGQSISDTDWADANSACGGTLVRPAGGSGGASGGLSGQIWTGLSYDSNASGPLAVQFDILNLPLPSKDGLAVIAGMRFSGKSEGYYDKGGAYGSFSLAAKNSIDGPDQRYEVGEIRAGYGRQSGESDFSLGAAFRHGRIFNKSYVTEAGVDARIGLKSDETSRLYLRGEASYQWYGKLGPGNNGNGWRLDAGIAYEKKLGEDSWFAAGAAVEHKDAILRDIGYVGGRVYAAMQRPIADNGAYYNLSATVRYIDFKDSAPVLDRRDLRATVRGAIGLPLTQTGLIFEVGTSYTTRQVTNKATVNPRPAFQANIADYGSVGAEARLIWKF